ncbi:MAG: zf-HC2 domain-containing protein [Planctomycetales bacterium]|nr:zf-HC2 domain-containing protein [Planctomycetales bacterium]
MNCQAVQDQLVAFVLDELSVEERADLELHIQEGCEECNQQLRDVYDGIDLLFDAVPRSQISRKVVDRTLALASGSMAKPCNKYDEPSVSEPRTIARFRDYGLSDAHFTPRTSPGSSLKFLLCSAASFLVGIFGMACLLSQSPLSKQQVVNHQEGLNGSQPPESGSIDFGGATPLPPSVRIANDATGSTSFVSLRQTNSSLPDQLRGCVIWDFIGKQIHFYGSHFPRPSAKHEYVLWVTNKAGSDFRRHPLTIGSDGSCEQVVEMISSDVPSVYVSLEQVADKSLVPTGEIELSVEVDP